MTAPRFLLHTARLRLRIAGTEDVDALLRIFGDPDVTRYWGHPPLADRNAAEAYAADIEASAEAGTLYQWAIFPHDASELVGTCSLADVDPTHRRAEFGLALAPEARGCGYAVEAGRAVLAYGFATMGLHRVTADVDPRNAPSLRMLRRLGFREEGRLREHYRQHDEWQDGILFGLLTHEWQILVEDTTHT